jgi:transposase
METTERNKPRPRRSFSPEFKAEIVERCAAGDRTVSQLARDFDLTETAVRAWVNQAQTDAGQPHRARPPAPGEPPAEHRQRDAQKSDSFFREGDAMNVDPFHRGGRSRGSQRCQRL